MVFDAHQLAAPKTSETYEIGGQSPETAIRHAAMLALTSVRGQETPTFKALTRLCRSRPRSPGRDRRIAASVRNWSAEDVPALAETVFSYIRSAAAPGAYVAGPLDALQFADSLAALLPA